MYANANLIGVETLPKKFFVNVAHCAELPGPKHDVEEDEAAKLMDADLNDFKIPISLGEIELAEDRQGETIQKVKSIFRLDAKFMLFRSML